MNFLFAAGVLAYSEKQLQAVLVRLEVRAPMDGTITSVLTKNIGEIVTPGTLLATLVPQGAELIVEANVTNRDAGPLRDRIGESVKLKFDAFPFRDFGTLNGTLVEVAHDAQPSENLGLVYRVAISFRPEPLSRGRQQGRVRLGMTVTGEIFKDRERVLMTLFRNLRDRVSVD